MKTSWFKVPDKALLVFLLMVLVTMASVLVNGYYADSTDLSLYLSYLPLYEGHNTYYPADLLLMAKYAGGHYYTFGLYIIILLKKFISLSLACFLIHIICQYFIFLTFYFLTIELFQKKEIAWLAVGLLMFKKMVVGTPVCTLEDVFSVRSIALPILFLSLMYYSRGKNYLSFILAGIAGDFHLLSSGIVLGVMVLATGLEMDTRKYKNLVISLLCFFLALSPVLIWRGINYGKYQFSLPFHSTPEWLNIIHIRAPYLYLSKWGSLSLLTTLAMFLLIILMMIKKREKSLSPVFYRLMLASGIISLMSIIVTEFDFPLAISFQIVRSTWYLNYFLMIFIAWLCYDSWSKRTEVNQALALILYFCWLFPFQRWGIVLSLIPLSLLVINQKESFVSKKYWSYVVLPSGLFVFIIAGIWSLSDSSFESMNVKSIFGNYISSINIYSSKTKDNWINVQLWAKENTPPGSLFITPPDLTGFRYHSERSTFVENKDGAMSVYSLEYARVWEFRMKQLGIKPRLDTRNYKIIYDNLPPYAILKVAEFNGAEYLVTRSYVDPGFKLLYQNKEYSVWKISTD